MTNEKDINIVKCSYNKEHMTHLCKLQLVQELSEDDSGRRTEFYEIIKISIHIKLKSGIKRMGLDFLLITGLVAEVTRNGQLNLQIKLHLWYSYVVELKIYANKK